MTSRDTRPATVSFREAAEADLIDQVIEVAPELEADVPPELPVDATEADVIDQVLPVSVTDEGYDDYPAGGVGETS